MADMVADRARQPDVGFMGPPVLAAKPVSVLSVSSTNEVVSSGFVGGPFSPSSQMCTVTDAGNANDLPPFAGQSS
jgi:hypothetical protein